MIFFNLLENAILKALQEFSRITSPTSTAKENIQMNNLEKTTTNCPDWIWINLDW